MLSLIKTNLQQEFYKMFCSIKIKLQQEFNIKQTTILQFGWSRIIRIILCIPMGNSVGAPFDQLEMNKR